MLHAEYRALGAAAKKRLREAGQAATLRWRTDTNPSNSSFGKRWYRKERLRAQHRLRVENWARCQNLPPAERAFALSSYVPAEGWESPDTLRQKLAMARGASRLDKKARREEDAKLEQALATWQDSQGREVVNDLAKAMDSPMFKELEPAFTPLPSQHVTFVQFVARSAEAAVAATARARSSATNLRARRCFGGIGTDAIV